MRLTIKIRNSRYLLVKNEVNKQLPARQNGLLLQAEKCRITRIRMITQCYKMKSKNKVLETRLDQECNKIVWSKLKLRTNVRAN